MAQILQLSLPQKVTIVESIIEQVVAKIMDGTLKEGDKLPSERQLIETLHVSRSSVREALQALAAMDLVETRPGGGTVVKKPRTSFGLEMNIDTLSGKLQKEMRHHLNQARLTLELGIISLAAENITEANKEAIQKAIDAYETSVDSVSGDGEGWEAHDQMHLVIAEATGNPILVSILQTLLNHVPVTLRRKGQENILLEERRSHAESDLNVHRQLCESVIRGNAAEACEWMHRHFDIEEQIIDEYYGNQGMNTL
jgi:GntR family transcriptional repressor for pyruvate dehydrogenase complex